MIVTPWLYGERTPWRTSSCAVDFTTCRCRPAARTWYGRSSKGGVQYPLLQAVERFTRRRLEPIRFIGGGARSDVWCQIFADVLGRTIEQVADPVNAGTRGQTPY